MRSTASHTTSSLTPAPASSTTHTSSYSAVKTLKTMKNPRIKSSARISPFLRTTNALWRRSPTCTTQDRSSPPWCSRTGSTSSPGITPTCTRIAGIFPSARRWIWSRWIPTRAGRSTIQGYGPVQSTMRTSSFTRLVGIILTISISMWTRLRSIWLVLMIGLPLSSV